MQVKKSLQAIVCAIALVITLQAFSSAITANLGWKAATLLKLPAGAQEIAGAAGGYIGAVAGAEHGGTLGASIGCIGGPLGATIGGFVGACAGAY